jgi:glycosyltransferase involved in cell wall biosynthesis
MNTNIELAVNNLSFGFCSFNILKEFIDMGEDFSFFPIGGNLDFSCFDKTSDETKKLIVKKAEDAPLKFDRKDPHFKLWHISGSHASMSDKRILMTFFELDSITDTEKNILRNHDIIMVTSKFTKQVFEEHISGVPVVYCPLGFDETHFSTVSKRAYPNDIISFSIFGKLEKRKHHVKAIQGWLKKFGNSHKHVLNLHVYNPHLTPEQNNALMNNLFQGKRYFNVNVQGYVQTLTELNQGYNACDIVIDMSGGEGFSLPSFHCIGLGKHGVLHNCSAISDWANEENAVLVQPTGKEEVYDGMFFQKGGKFNQGNIFTWNEEDYLSALDSAVERYTKNPINDAGKKLKEDFSWKKCATKILETIKV